MKRIAGKLLLLIPLSLIVLLTIAILTRKVRAEERAGRLRILPDLVMTDLKGVEYKTAQLSSGPLLIAFFHPECDHCRYELSSLKDIDTINSNVKIFLISHADRNQIGSFIRELKISDTGAIYIFHDPDLTLSKYFGADVIPSNFIYNDSLRLVKVFKGSVKPETIFKYLNGSN